VGLKDIAQQLGLSVATVSVVLNDAPAAKVISQGTKDRIRAAAAELKYRPNFFARNLRRQRSFTVGVMVPEISEGYAATVMSGIEERLLDRGYLYFLASHGGHPDLIEEYPELLLERGLEGLILVNTPARAAFHVPVVAVAGHEYIPGVVNVRLDNERAAWLAIEHLALLGHRDIAVFKGHPGSADTEARWQGISRAAAALGVNLPPELTLQLQGTSLSPEGPSRNEGYEYGQKLLAVGRPFTALVAFNDITALGAIRAFQDAGRDVPSDVSVVGFDDIQAAAFHNPRLTTVRQPMRKMGEVAANALLDCIANVSGGGQTILIEPELITRESTARAILHDSSTHKTSHAGIGD